MSYLKTQKNTCFSIPLKTETTDNDYEITYNLRFIDTNRFLTKSLANAVEDLSELNKPIKCKKYLERKNKYDSCCYFDKLVDNRLQYKCKDCSTYSYKPLNPLKERFKNTYEFCNDNKTESMGKVNNKFILLLRKGVYPYEYMDSFERLKETKLPEYRTLLFRIRSNKYFKK